MVTQGASICLTELPKGSTLGTLQAVLFDFIIQMASLYVDFLGSLADVPSVLIQFVEDKLAFQMVTEILQSGKLVIIGGWCCGACTS